MTPTDDERALLIEAGWQHADYIEWFHPGADYPAGVHTTADALAIEYSRRRQRDESEVRP